MMRIRYALLAVMTLAAPCLFAVDFGRPAQPKGDLVLEEHKYTPPDPSAPGGIKGRLILSAKPVFEVLALSFNDPKKVYRATFKDTDKKEFEITGLPMEKYDLVVISDDVIYEGLTLDRDGDTLTSRDSKLIEEIIMKSEAFYAQKVLLRTAGTTGKGNKARSLVAFVRNKESHDQGGVTFTDHRRSIKLVQLMDVGPGWQVALARELYVSFVKPGTGPNIKGAYRESLNSIRVTDKIKDLGEINLLKAGGND